jgi:hypothetical protein
MIKKNHEQHGGSQSSILTGHLYKCSITGEGGTTVRVFWDPELGG